ncbi:MAG: radical SAM protein, partial [Deltaproteobacteria bacterium]|nr:radical SAM protein [Deltaproteobacteria bacterium]
PYKSLATKEFGNFLESLFANGDFFNPCGIGPDSLPVQFSRGCAKNPPYRVKSLARIEEELNSIAETGHTRRLCVIDAEANLRGDFKELLRLLKRYRISFDFLNGLTADEIDEETAMLLSGSVTSVSFPVNSEKNRDTIAIENAFSACSTQGIASFADVTIGLPGETARDINGILDLAYKAFDSYGTEPLIHFPVPLRGSGFSHSEPGFDPADAYNLPLFDTGEVKRDELKELKRNFIKKIHASGTRKLIINLTYRCNNHCIFCAVGNRSSVDGDTEVQKKILLDYARKGVRMLDLDGGEPTIFKDVLKIIKFARELGYKSINVTTNGRTLSYPQVAEKLLKSGITSLLISLHGHTREIHTLHTRVQESFAQTLRGIQNAIINNFFEVRLGINTTISAYNYKHLKELAKFIISLGIQRINFQLITPFGRASNEIVPDPGSAAAELKKVIDEYASRIKISVINLPLCFMRGYEEFLIADLFKLERNMFFVTNEDVNLYKYLAKKRRKTTECGNCAHALICDGFYTFEDEGEAVGCAPVATI